MNPIIRSSPAPSRCRLPARLLLLLVAASTAIAALAHEGEDHSKDKKAMPGAAAAGAALSRGLATREAPSRLNDGSLFVPKPVQRELGLRTLRVETAALQATIELNGRVIAQPGALGRVQATQAGTVLAGPRGFPAPGMKVRPGEVLAWLLPSVGALERGATEAELAELAAQAGLAEQRAARLVQLEGSVPAKEIQTARVEAQALRERLHARRSSVEAQLPLIAPAGGVVSTVQVALGEVVDAKDVLFEIVDPARLAVEALAYDAALPRQLGEADGIVPGPGRETLIKLRLAGAGLQLREQALPVIFRVASASAPLAIGQSVKVLARTRASEEGIAVPRSALGSNGAGDPIVWVHTEAERFVPRRVVHRPLDANRVAVSAGLRAGERVVTDGATLLAQVR